MLAPFIVCLREGVEIFLVIIPLVVYFNKSKLYEMSRGIYLGGTLGALVATVIGTIIFSQAALLNGTAGELFDGILGVVLAGLILYSVVLIRKNKFLNTEIDKKYISYTKKGVFILAGITFFREFLEAFLFILASSSKAPMLVVGSALAGFICAAVIVYLIAKGISNLDIRVVFYVLNLFLVGLGAYYFADGLEVLFGTIVPQIFDMGLLVYAIPSYIIIIKKDLKKYLSKIK
ncbi:MAG: FTR1 family protein [Solirubrobacterales bacterium]